MGDDSLILREDGYIRMNFPVTSLTYHSNLNIILVKTDVGGVHVLDVNSGVILQSSCLSAGKLNGFPLRSLVSLLYFRIINKTSLHYLPFVSAGVFSGGFSMAYIVPPFDSSR